MELITIRAQPQVDALAVLKENKELRTENERLRKALIPVLSTLTGEHLTAAKAALKIE